MPFELPPHLAGQQGNMNFQPEAQATGKDPMVRWYEVNDGPWHPPGLTSGTGDGGGRSMMPSMRDNQFIVPSRSNIPSEIMPHSDSGYGSYQNQTSIANGSVCDDSFDTNPDTQSIMGGSMVDTRFSVSDVVSETPIALNVPCEWGNPIRIETVTMRCRVCGKKHDQRHKKPFKCDVQECPRRLEGFSTTNDLDRHKRSVHPGSQTSGHRYVCPIGPCKSKDKIWPRADNFKAHLKRVHSKEPVPDEYLESCIYKLPTSVAEPQDNPRQDEVMSDYEYSGLANGQANSWPRFLEAAHSIGSLGPLSEAQGEETLSLSASQQGLANLHIHHTAPHPELYQQTTQPDPVYNGPILSSSPIQHNKSPRESEASESTSPPSEEQMAQVPRGHPTGAQVTGVDESRFGLLDESGEPLLKHSPAHSIVDDLVKTDDGISDSTDPEDFFAHETGLPKFDFRNPDMNVLRKFVDDLQSRGLLEPLGLKKEGCGTAEPTKAEGSPTTNPHHRHLCSTCGKIFPRKCELKKHEKRHEKPYGCTMPGCERRFGSKNDWKRHENTQHPMSETWRGRNGGTRKEISEWKDFDLSKRGTGDSEDGDDSGLSARVVKAHRSSREGIHHPLGHLKSKRKRDDVSNASSAKKSRVLRSVQCAAAAAATGMKGTWQHVPLPSLPRSSHSLDVVAGNAYVFGGEVEARKPVDNDMHVVVLPWSGAPADYYAIKAKPSPRTSADDEDTAVPPVTEEDETDAQLRDPLTEVPLGSSTSTPGESESSTPDKGKTPETADVPAPRIGHATAVIGSRIFLFGGRSAAAGSPIPPARSYHSATATEKPRDFALKPLRLRRSSTWKEWAEGDSAEVGIPQRPIPGTIAEKSTDDEAAGAGFGTFIIHAGCLADGTRGSDVWAFDVH
ncbi:hypothetical protein EKO27_g7355, partial [Xylaria grammica]